MSKNTSFSGILPVNLIAPEGEARYSAVCCLARGSNCIPPADGDYRLYSPYNPASPITEITADGNAFSNGMSAVLSANERGREAKVFGNLKVEIFIHLKYDDTNGSLFDAFCIDTGPNLNAACLALHERSKGKTSDPPREAGYPVHREPALSGYAEQKRKKEAELLPHLKYKHNLEESHMKKCWKALIAVILILLVVFFAVFGLAKAKKVFINKWFVNEKKLS